MCGKVDGLAQKKTIGLFRFLAVGAALAAVEHMAALAGFLKISTAPPWRHALFIVVDTGLCGLMILKPRWLYLPALLVAIQGVFSHGTHAWNLWFAQRRVDWLSVAVLLYMPLLLWAAFLNAQEKNKDERGLSSEWGANWP
jgi:hypothetical protein